MKVTKAEQSTEKVMEELATTKLKINKASTEQNAEKMQKEFESRWINRLRYKRKFTDRKKCLAQHSVVCSHLLIGRHMYSW